MFAYYVNILPITQTDNSVNINGLSTMSVKDYKYSHKDLLCDIAII